MVDGIVEIVSKSKVTERGREVVNLLVEASAKGEV